MSAIGQGNALPVRDETLSSGSLPRTPFEGVNTEGHIAVGTVAVRVLSPVDRHQREPFPLPREGGNVAVSTIDRIKNGVVIFYGCSELVISLASAVFIIYARLFSNSSYVLFGSATLYTSAGGAILAYQNFRLKSLGEEVDRLKAENNEYESENDQHAQLNAEQQQEIERQKALVEEQKTLVEWQKTLNEQLKTEVAQLHTDVSNLGDEVLREEAMLVREELAVEKLEEILEEQNKINTSLHIAELLQQRDPNLYQQYFDLFKNPSSPEQSSHALVKALPPGKKSSKNPEWCRDVLVEVMRTIKARRDNQNDFSVDGSQV